MSERPLLIVNADDFGLNAAATDAILECHRAGSVTSTTLMVGADDAERAAALAKDAPQLGVGLHFNLTWGRPVGRHPARSLVGDDGRFVERGEFAKRWLAGRLSSAAIRDELDAQLQRMSSLGLAPTHVDSHQHVHGFPVVFAAIADACRARGLPMRVPWVAAEPGAGVGRRLRRWALHRLLSRAVARNGAGIASNTSIGCVFDLGGAPPAAFGDEHYRALLEKPGPVHELMVHTVTDAEAMTGYTRVGTVAEREYRYLRGPALRRLAESLGWRLGTYRDVPRPPGAR